MTRTAITRVVPGLVPGIQRSTNAGASDAPDPGYKARDDRAGQTGVKGFSLLGIALCSAALLAGAMLHPHAASADGALAVGLPSDVAKQGLAMGYALNYANSEAAQEVALKRCREFRDAPQATRDQCKIVEKFSKRCVAIALDQDSGTTGLGWSVARSQEAAEGGAMEKCAETAGRKRQEFCRVTLTSCDGRR
jgi:Domain of unknown function (DUF4189)